MSSYSRNDSQPKSKEWFARLLEEFLRRYAKTASADYLAKKYPGLPKDVIAERYVSQQARVAAIAGAVSAAVVSGAVIVSGLGIVTTVGIPALAITIPAAVGALAVEMAYTIRLQVKTAFDLCNLYGLPIDLDDPEDLLETFAVGMGIKAGELTGNVLQKIAPSIAIQQARGLMRTGLIRRSIQNWAAKNLSREIARRYLAEGVLLKAIVPGVSIFLAAGWNYYFTKGLGRTVQARVRGRGMSIEYVDEIPLTAKSAPELVLATALNIMMADTRVNENELAAYRAIGDKLQQLHPGFTSESLGSQWGNSDNWLAKVAAVEDEETQKTIYAVAETMTILDGQVNRTEIKRLKEITKLLGVTVDENRLKIRAKPFYVAPAGRGCAIAAWIVALILLIAACACSISLWFLAAHLFQAKP